MTLESIARTRAPRRLVPAPRRRVPEWLRTWPIALIALLMTLRLLIPGTAQAEVRNLPTDPVRTMATEAIGQDFADPTVLVVDGVYYAYATNSDGMHIQLMTSTDLVNWSSPIDTLPTLPGWARTGRTWAPEVVSVAGGYRMYYSAEEASSGRECISMATAATPQGPFRDTSTTPLICQLDRGGSIDPDVVADGTASYLIWKSEDNAKHKPTNIWARQLDPATGGFLAGSQNTRLLTATASWQQPSLEGPAMISDSGGYYLFYGAHAWDSGRSGIGYATCASPLGPCVDRTTAGPWLTGSGSMSGPQGPSFFTDSSGAPHLAFAAWVGGVGYKSDGRRALWTQPLALPQPATRR
jgi:beta-xylosidase